MEPPDAIDGHVPDDAIERALRLERLTIAWNACEVFVTIGLGIAAASIALVAFGLDSLVEIVASSVVFWQLRGDGDARTKRAMLWVAIAFFTLALVLGVGAVRALMLGVEPDASPVGVVYLGLTAVVMFMLAAKKRRLGESLVNHPLATEARITLLDGALATGVMMALILNGAFGVWWADSVAALAVAAVAVREGFDAWGDSR